MNPEAPSICITGPMIGRNPGMVTTQGERVADLLAGDGYRVISTSASPNRYRRLAEIAATIVRRRREIGVLCVQTYSGPAFVVDDVATWLGRRFRLPIIMHVHGGAMPTFIDRFPRWTRRVLARADLLVVPSGYLAGALADHGFAAEVIPNVIELADYSYRPRRVLRPRLLWMRTFHPVYDPEMAVRVLARVRQSVPDATLVMAGQEKGIGARVRSLVDELGLKEAVRFAGFLDAEGKRREGDAADVFLNTNRVDNTPVSVIEACAMGLPVVATDVGGVRHLLADGESGLLVAEGDDEAMAAAVLRLLSDPALAGRLSDNGRTLAERSSWERVRPLWMTIFDRLAARRRPTCATTRPRTSLSGG
jgi:glycosyltransferase involved in cell wall biosynthesis